MTTLQEAIGHAGSAVLAATLAGVLIRKRYREWYSFALFLAYMVVYQALINLWPAHFYQEEIWMLKESVQSLLRLGMALELAFRTFRGFPGALATARWTLFACVALIFITVVAAPTPRLDYLTFLGQIQPRILNGSIWLFTAIAALILWYRVPVHPFHKRVLLSYVPYLLVFTVAMNSIGAFGWERGQLMIYANQLAHLALLVYWTYAAWSPETVPAPARALARPA